MGNTNRNAAPMTRGHDDLARQVSAERIAALLPAASAAERDIVRVIIQHNILSNRVSGLMSHKRLNTQPDWLDAYAPRVHVFYRSEQQAWHAVLIGGHTEAFHARVHAMAQLKFRQIALHHPDAQIDLDDVTHEACDLLFGRRRLRDYAFDEPLSAWLGRAVMQAARALYGAKRGVQLVPIDDTQELYLPERLVVSEEICELRAAIGISMRALSALDQRIVHLRHAGVTVTEIANLLGLTQKTVYRRHTAAFEHMRALLG
jgi:RNA polymerase sigma factor (sigma-70 family)